MVDINALATKGRERRQRRIDDALEDAATEVVDFFNDVKGGNVPVDRLQPVLTAIRGGNGNNGNGPRNALPSGGNPAGPLKPGAAELEQMIRDFLADPDVSDADKQQLFGKFAPKSSPAPVMGAKEALQVLGNEASVSAGDIKLIRDVVAGKVKTLPDGTPSDQADLAARNDELDKELRAVRDSLGIKVITKVSHTKGPGGDIIDAIDDRVKTELGANKDVANKAALKKLADDLVTALGGVENATKDDSIHDARMVSRAKVVPNSVFDKITKGVAVARPAAEKLATDLA